jgi:hypothetical protein
MSYEHFFLHDLYLRGEHLAKLLREAELARLAASIQPMRRPFYFPALSWLGVQLVFWGRQLQKRYDVNACCADPLPPI